MLVLLNETRKVDKHIYINFLVTSQIHMFYRAEDQQ